MRFFGRIDNRGKTLGMFLASFVLGVMPYAAWSAEATPARPNVLFIAIDDQNSWTGCLGGHPDAKTPNIDRLAARGMNFTRAYCPAPHCNPSRASLMWGKLPSTSGVYGLDDNSMAAMSGVESLTNHFMNNGYWVVGAGKIFHKTSKDFWHEYMNRPGDPSPPKEKRPLNGIPGNNGFDWGPLDVTDEQMSDGKIAQWAVEQLGKKYDKPFFIGVGFFRPHMPWYVPRKYFDMFSPEKITLPAVKEDDLDDVPAIGKKFALEGVGFKAMQGGDHQQILKYNKWREAVCAYLACCAFTDAQLGKVLEAFDRSPYAKNTIVVLWSDHGWHLGQKLHWRKHALWEEATHNVLLFDVPGLTRPGMRCDVPVGLVDIYPTLVDLCRISPPEGLEGLSLVPLIKDPQAKWDRPALSTYGQNNHALRTSRWRYIRYADGTEELYHHDHDELEWTNLAGDPKYDEVKKELAKWFPKVNVIPESEKNPARKGRSRENDQ